MRGRIGVTFAVVVFRGAATPGRTGQTVFAPHGRTRRAAALPFVYDKVYGHLALQAADVAVTKVIAEFMNLKENKYFNYIGHIAFDMNHIYINLLNVSTYTNFFGKN